MQLQGDYYGPLKNEKRKKKLIKVIIIIVAKGSCLFLINTIILQILKISVMIVVVFGFSFVHQIKKNTEQNNTAYVTCHICHMTLLTYSPLTNNSWSTR